MPPIIFLVIILITFLKPITAFPSDDAESLVKCLKLLEKGTEKEKRLALIDLPSLLRYPAIQKKTTFNPTLQALKDKNPSIRAAAAASLKHFGKFHPGYLGEKEGMARRRESVEKGDPRSREGFAEAFSYHEARNLIVPHLVEALGDSEPRVREEAARALAYYKNEYATDELIRGLHDKDPWVRLNVVFALGELKALKAVDLLLNFLEDDLRWRNKFGQQECVIAIRKIVTPEIIRKGDGRYIGTIHRELSKPITAGGLDSNTAAKVISVFIRKSDDPYLKAEIIKALGQFKAAEAKDMLLKATEDADKKIRKLALGALLQISDAQPKEGAVAGLEKGKKYGEDIFAVLKKSTKDPSAQVRAMAVTALGKSGDERAIYPLIEALGDSGDEIKSNAIGGLAQFGDERILDHLIPFFGEQRWRLGDSAAQTFISVANKTAKERVYVYRKNGIRYVSQNIPRQTKVRERRIHPVAVGKLIEIIGHSNEEGSLSALGLLGQFEDWRIEGILLKLLDDPAPKLRARAASLIPSFSDKTVLPRLIEASKNQDSYVRENAVRALGEFEDKRALEPLKERLGDSHPEVRVAALNSLKTYDDQSLSDPVIKLLRDDSLSVRRAAILNIKERRDRNAVEALVPLLDDPDYHVVNFAAEALGSIGDKRAVDPLIRALKGEFNKNRADGGDAGLRMNAAKALGSIGDRSAVPALIECLAEKNPFLRRGVVSALKEIGDPAGLEAIRAIPKDDLPPEIGAPKLIQPELLRPSPPSILLKQPPVGRDSSPMIFKKDERKEEK
jgi:HEAT repeat protein